MREIRKIHYAHTFCFVLQGTLRRMLGLERLVRDLGGRAVVMHRLGGRHIGTGPLESKWKRGQIVSETCPSLDLLNSNEKDQNAQKRTNSEKEKRR